MAIIRNAANTLLKGRVGQTTYYISKGQQVARQSRNDSNYGDTARRTQMQQDRRVLWANLVQFYKISSRWMPKAFESKGIGQTDYNKFMAVNLASAHIALTKSQAEAAACVVDGFIISQGSLPSIELTTTVSGIRTNIGVGSLTIDATTTIGAFSQAAIDNNANIRAGMQLSCAVYTQSVDPLGTPRAICRLYEVTIDPNSTNLLRAYMPEFISTVIDGYIGTSGEMQTGGFAYILSELQTSGLKVSTQLLQIDNAALINQFSSETQRQVAAESYGIDQEVILNPDTLNAQSEEGVQGYITRIGIETDEIEEPIRYVTPGGYVGQWGQMYQKAVHIYTNGLTNQTVSNVKLYDGTFAVMEQNATISEDGVITTTFTNVGHGSTRIVSKITVTLSDGLVLEVEFATT